MPQVLENKKILIIDDELDMRIFLCNLLGNCGYEPIGAGDTKAGMQEAEREKPALIILDATMPSRNTGTCRHGQTYSASSDGNALLESHIHQTYFQQNQDLGLASTAIRYLRAI